MKIEKHDIENLKSLVSSVKLVRTDDILLNQQTTTIKVTVNAMLAANIIERIIKEAEAEEAKE